MLLLNLSMISFHNVITRTNKYGLPIITSLYSKAYEVLQGSYYGYVNSDILIQPTIFTIMDYCQKQVEKGNLAEEV